MKEGIFFSMRYNTAEGETHEFQIENESVGMRLDVFLAERMEDSSRSFIRHLIDDELVRVDGNLPKAGLKLKAGMLVELFMPELVEMSAEPENIPLEILYEDNDLIVINKAAGMVVHPSPGHESGTLVNALLYHCGDLSGVGGVLRPGIVHRLDRDTTGCLVAAKNDQAHRALCDQFAARTTQKTYVALTKGFPVPLFGQVEGLIGRHPVHRQKQAMLKDYGRYSLTLYKTLDTFENVKVALVECDLKTGRTHQIRVHMKHIHAPLLCDEEYGDGKKMMEKDLGGSSDRVVIQRQALHAKSLRFTHPQTGERLQFIAQLPTDMEDALEVLRQTK